MTPTVSLTQDERAQLSEEEAGQLLPELTAIAMRVEGPEIEDETGVHAYRVHGADCTLRFWTLPPDGAERTEWAVRIERIPGPGIIHETPWLGEAEVREAALAAIRDILLLERMHHEEGE